MLCITAPKKFQTSFTESEKSKRNVRSKRRNECFNLAETLIGSQRCNGAGLVSFIKKLQKWRLKGHPGSTEGNG